MKRAHYDTSAYPPPSSESNSVRYRSNQSNGRFCHATRQPMLLRNEKNCKYQKIKHQGLSYRQQYHPNVPSLAPYNAPGGRPAASTNMHGYGHYHGGQASTWSAQRERKRPQGQTVGQERAGEHTDRRNRPDHGHNRMDQSRSRLGDRTRNRPTERGGKRPSLGEKKRKRVILPGGYEKFQVTSKRGDTREFLDQQEEIDMKKIAQRQKQINFGKDTVGYANYTATVKRKDRGKDCPRTPDPKKKYSKRAFDGIVKVWRRLLHKYDDVDVTSAKIASTTNPGRGEGAGPAVGQGPPPRLTPTPHPAARAEQANAATPGGSNDYKALEQELEIDDLL